MTTLEAFEKLRIMHPNQLVGAWHWVDGKDVPTHHYSADVCRRSFHGSTMEEVVEKTRLIDPAHLAAEKREQAAKLLAEAEKLCPTPGQKDGAA